MDILGDVGGTELLTRGQKLLLNKSAEFGTDVAAAIAAGKKRLTNEYHFVRRQITAFAGGQPIIDTTIEKAAGISTLNKGKLPSNVSMLLMGISLKYAPDSNSGTDAGIPLYTIYDTGVPAGILNGEIEIRISDKPLPRIPVNKLLAFGDVVTNNGLGRDVLYIENGIPITDKDDIAVDFFGPAGATVPGGATYFLELGLVGPGFRNR